MNIVMIAIHKQGNKIIGFRLLDTDSGKVQDVPYDNMKEVLKAEKVEVENIKLEGDRLIGTNGNFQRYPSILNGILYGKSPLIVLFELVDNKFRVTNYMGEIVDISEQEAIKYSETEGIANGKVVTNEDGRKYLSSISGAYKVDKLVLDKQYGKKLAAKMKLLGASQYTLDEKYYAKVANKEIESIQFNRGVLGIVENGCADMKNLKSVILPETLEHLGEGSFYGCISLEKIEIPEGIKVLPKRCFAYCTNLIEVHLPNSLREIHGSAFIGCNKLEVIYTGTAPIAVVYGAVPRGVKRIKRSS